MGKIAIIGGGVSGMCAAISCRRAGGNVTVLVTNRVLGKKILKTGGGRCNFANEDTGIKHFHSNNNEHVKSVFGKYNLENILSFLKSIGISSKSVNGWLYPYSMQAKSFRDALLLELSVIGCNVMCETKVNTLNLDGNRFIIGSSKGVLDFDKVIIACGGMAAPETGSDGAGLRLAKGLQHNITPILPALSPLISDDVPLKHSSGIRVDAGVNLIIDGKNHKEVGNLQITDYGISGIVVMQLSYLAARALYEKKPVVCEIDFASDYKKSDIKKEIEERYVAHGRGKSAENVLIGFLPDKVISTVLLKSGINPKTPAINLPEAAREILLNNIKAYRINIINSRGFSHAQSTYGGVSLEDIDKNTLLSKKYKNLGFAGEVLDVCGDCGGYNIMWAIASGLLVGNSILGGK